MDGVMIDSEPFWQETEHRVFANLGIELSKSPMEQTMGMRIDQVVEYWFERFPWDERVMSKPEVEAAILDGVKDLVESKGKALPGLEHSLNLIEKFNLKLGLATSSDEMLIDAVLGRFGIADRFEVTVSARHEKEGKPNPAVYLTAARKLGVAPSDCLAIEDSATGLEAALNAGMKTIVIPRPEYPEDKRFEKADHRLSSLEQLSRDHLL